MRPSPASSHPACTASLHACWHSGHAARCAQSRTTVPLHARLAAPCCHAHVLAAGTDANVTLQLFGEHGGKKYQSEVCKLENSANNFERAQTDTFEVQAAVGEIKYIRIGHDNAGIGASWHLQEVILSSPGMADTQFIANRCDGSAACQAAV